MFLFEYPQWINFKFGRWEIKDGAPKHVKEAFEKAQRAYAEALEKGGIVE